MTKRGIFEEFASKMVPEIMFTIVHSNNIIHLQDLQKRKTLYSPQGLHRKALKDSNKMQCSSLQIVVLAQSTNED